jgi:hypothetical protein
MNPLEASDKQAEDPEARIIVFSVCVGLPFKPTDEQTAQALAMLCRVVKEGMKLDVISAQCITMTREQAQKNFETAELDEATEESQKATKQ